MGEAHKTVLPDKAILQFDISATQKNESESYKKMNERASLVQNRLKAKGFTENQIKLEDFIMEANKPKKGKKIEYKSSQTLTVKFPLDKQKLLNTYTELMRDSIEGVEVQLETECSDELKKKTEEELIVLALKDAKEKATLITAAMDCSISSVLNIGYKYYSDQQPVRNTIKFTPPVIKSDDEIAYEDEPVANYFAIGEQEFSEQIKVTYTIQDKK